jgi:tRNA(Ile)-lysidine synthase
LAHHLDDLIETYIMQKNKNSLVNWWGIRECMEIENYRFWRPILNISKKEIVKYLKTNRIEYSIDKSNFEDIYTRNVIRKEIKDITIGEKKKILKEIENKNKKLKKNIKEIIKKIDVYKSSIDLKEVKSNKFNGEEIQRIFFLWVNQQTNNFLTKRKKKILREITRQLLESKKKEISINIGGGFVISKVGDISIIVRKNT